MTELLNLNGAWTLYLAPNEQVRKLSFSATVEADLQKTDFLKIPAEVPGNFELDLQRAGLLPDLYMGTNPLLAQKEENKHLWYVKRFSLSHMPESDPFFRFEGIDTFAEIYLNGKQIGSCDNMLIEHEYAADGLRIGENELVVHIHPTAIVIRKFEGNILNRSLPYNNDSLHARKAPYMFGWDIMPRFVSGGLWRSVSLIEKPRHRIEDFYIATSRIDGEQAFLHSTICIHTEEDFLSDFEAIIHGRCQDSTFEKKVNFFNIRHSINLCVPSPLLWWPRNTGAQNLYDITVTLYRKGELCDVYKTRLGIRTVRLERTSVIDEQGNGKFEFYVNDRRIFIMGTNWVPLDAFPSQNEKRLTRALEMVEDIGCNMIRLWGGNLYESDAFYDWCDERGILLWQDFIMGCAYYPQYAEFQEALRKEAVVAVKRLRSHPSLVLWAGDNECDSMARGTFKNGARVDPNENVLTRRVLPAVLQTYDGYRPYLPSSPYYDEVAFATDMRPPEDHLWGPRNYFKSDFYKNATALFASETGFHGCPSPDSLKRYIHPEHLWPLIRENGRPDEEWLVHAASMEIENISLYEYRIALMTRQVAELFGNAEQQSAEQVKASFGSPSAALRFYQTVKDLFGEGEAALHDFARASQIFQAEGFKYMIERFRIRKETHGGLIWWNLLDGWPQISDAIVDYYFSKKLAYDYIAKSQQPVCLMFDEPENGAIALFAANELPVEKRLTYTVIRHSDHATVCKGICVLSADGILKLTALPIDPEEAECFLIEWQDENGNVGRNHYVTNIRKISYKRYMSFLTETEIGHFEGFGEGVSL